MKKPAVIVQIAIGVLLLVKAFLLPIPMPPNISLTQPMLLEFASWTYLDQVHHWQAQAAGFENMKESEDRFGLGAATTRNLRWAWTFLIGSSVLGLALIGNALRSR